MTSSSSPSSDARDSNRSLLARAKVLPGYRPAADAAGCIRRGERGRDARARRFPPAGMFQPYGTTSLDRYPEEFALVAGILANAESPRLLSFGCSSGEELVTLLRYWPGATVRGLDVSPKKVRAARRLLRAKAAPASATVGVAADAANEEVGSYDAVFAMAVLRHGDLNDCPPSCSTRLRFAEVERVLISLAALLRPRGLLVLRHSNVRLADTGLAERFERVNSSAWPTATPIYGPGDHLQPHVVGDDGVFRLVS